MRYRYCPRCGGALQRPAEGQRQDAATCAACGFVFYRNSKPTTGAVVVRDGKVMLARRGVAPAKGAWDIPGGFLQHGEHPEQGLIRELREETGTEVRPTALIGMYIDVYGDDDDPDPDAILNIYYEAEIVSGEPQAADDVAELLWLAPDELPREGWAFAHSPLVVADWRRLRGLG
jgi:8-oxo-dGTP diphosphatase